MRENYDFSNAKRNPFSKELKKTITIRLSKNSIEYFKDLSKSIGIPYQNLMDMYLSDCAHNHKKLNMKWS